MAEATTVAGEGTVPPFVGLEIVRGKSLEPLGGGSIAGGAGRGLDCGDQVIGTGGVDGLLGCDGAVGVVGVVGVEVVVVVFCLLPVPHPLRITITANKSTNSNVDRTWRARQSGPVNARVSVIYFSHLNEVKYKQKHPAAASG